MEFVRSSNDGLSGREVAMFYESVVNGPVMAEDNPSNVSSRVPQSSPRHPEEPRRTVQPSQRRNHQKISDSRVIRAVQYNEVEVVQQYLSAGGNPDLRDEHGWTLLMIAACGNHLSLVKLLCENGANKSLFNPQMKTAVVLAAIKNNHNVIFYLRGGSRFQPGNEERAEQPTPSEPQEEFCEECQQLYTCSRISHLTSICHQLAIPRPPQPTQYHLPESNRGYRLMVRSGWNKEQGLGPSGQGPKFPVKTFLKHDRKGLGLKPASKPRVTHFQPYDQAAVKSPYEKPPLPRRINLKRELKRRERRDREKTRRIRMALS